jgi:GIY-YIG catalytic domain.
MCYRIRIYYVGMTQRSLRTRLSEHKASARNNKPEKSNFAKHVLETGHNMNAAKQEIL